MIAGYITVLEHRSTSSMSCPILKTANDCSLLLSQINSGIERLSDASDLPFSLAERHEVLRRLSTAYSQLAVTNADVDAELKRWGL